MRALAMLVGIAVCGCATAATESRAVTTIAIVFSVGGTIYDVNVGTDTALVPSQRVERLVSSVARDARDSSAFVVAYDSFANRVARPLNLKTGRVTNGASLSALESALGGSIPANLGFGESTALSDAGDQIVFVRSTRDAIPGVTSVKTATWSVDWFLPSLSAGAGAFGRWHNRDVLFVAGRRAATGMSPTYLWALDPPTGQLLDSIQVGAPSVIQDGGVLRVVYSALAARVLIQRPGLVISCLADLPKNTSCASVTVNSVSGRLSYRRDDNVALIYDAGSRDGPGTGKLFAVTLEASRVDEHELPLVNGDRFVSQGVTTSRGGALWIVIGGTFPLAASFQPQPSVVLLYDPVAHRVLKRLEVPNNDGAYFPVGL